jgi:hypothetical protein
MAGIRASIEFSQLLVKHENLYVQHVPASGLMLIGIRPRVFMLRSWFR